MPPRPFNFLAAMGQSPQVITETLFEIKRTEDRVPTAVHVVTTRVGRAYGNALLLGNERSDPLRGGAIEGTADRWMPFCLNVLGRSAPASDAEEQQDDETPDYPVDLTFHVPEVDDRGLGDIRRRGDDTQFANLCYRLVEQLTREDAFPLVGSIAGGRKTMSAHLMTAFSVYARPEDRLTHVLLSDPDLERDPSFFYPEEGTPGYARLLDLVDVRFPRLRTVIEADLIDGLPDDRRDLEGILDVLDPHIQSARRPDCIELRLTDHGAAVHFSIEGEEIGRCELTPARAATLAVFAEHAAAHDGAVPVPAFVGSERVHEQRSAVMSLCAEGAPKPWTATEDLSKARHALNERLARVPLADRYLYIDNLSGTPVRYTWHEAPPVSIDVTSRFAGEKWPFDHLEMHAFDRS